MLDCFFPICSIGVGVNIHFKSLKKHLALSKYQFWIHVSEHQYMLITTPSLLKTKCERANRVSAPETCSFLPRKVLRIKSWNLAIFMKTMSYRWCFNLRYFIEFEENISTRHRGMKSYPARAEFHIILISHQAITIILGFHNHALLWMVGSAERTATSRNLAWYLTILILNLCGFKSTLYGIIGTLQERVKCNIFCFFFVHGEGRVGTSLPDTDSLTNLKNN